MRFSDLRGRETLPPSHSQPGPLVMAPTVPCAFRHFTRHRSVSRPNHTLNPSSKPQKSHNHPHNTRLTLNVSPPTHLHTHSTPTPRPDSPLHTSQSALE